MFVIFHGNSGHLGWQLGKQGYCFGIAIKEGINLLV